MEKGMEVNARFGILHLGDIIKVKLYEKAGKVQKWYEGELVYHSNEARFLIKDPKIGLSYNLDMATKPEVIKKWDAPE